MKYLEIHWAKILLITAVLVMMLGFAVMTYANTKDKDPKATAKTENTLFPQKGTIPVKQIQKIMQAQGDITKGVLEIGIDRSDIGTIILNNQLTSERIPFKPPFQFNGQVFFQPIGNGRALMNGDMGLKTNEVNKFIAALLKNGITVQALHQHFIDLEQQVWFVHFRAIGNPITIATGVHNAIKVTSTKLPQTKPKNPRTPLNAKRLQTILHGFASDVSSDGVVTVRVARRNLESIHGVHASNAAGIATEISFQPLNSEGTKCAVAPDYGMIANEVDRVIGFSLANGWDQGCLYNQETAEIPQLYFNHQIKTGDPYILAAQVRKALDKMNTQ